MQNFLFKSLMPNSKPRIIYFAIITFIIVLGLLSRKSSSIPLYVGDILWATMVFFIIRFLLIDDSWKKVAVIALLICFTIEASQLYEANWINLIRRTLPGRLILGQGFLWSDLIAYIIGVCGGVIINRLTDKRIKNI